MRRNDKEITDAGQLNEILNECMVCRIGMLDQDNQVYILPVNFGHTYNQGKLEIYFHGALEGKKVDLLKPGNVAVGIEMDCGHGLRAPEDTNANNNACSYGYRYVSIIGNGHGSIIDDEQEKMTALNHLMHHQTGKYFEFTKEDVNSVAVFKIVIDTFSGKGRR